MTEKRTLLSRVGRWTAELVLVFVGVYGAFWLKSHDCQENGNSNDNSVPLYA